MRRFFISFLILFIFSFLFSCSKSSSPESNANNLVYVDVMINLEFIDEGYIWNGILYGSNFVVDIYFDGNLYQGDGANCFMSPEKSDGELISTTVNTFIHPKNLLLGEHKVDFIIRNAQFAILSDYCEIKVTSMIVNYEQTSSKNYYCDPSTYDSGRFQWTGNGDKKTFLFDIKQTK
jgi:hypothetical protein